MQEERKALCRRFSVTRGARCKIHRITPTACSYYGDNEEGEGEREGISHLRTLHQNFFIARPRPPAPGCVGASFDGWGGGGQGRYKSGRIGHYRRGCFAGWSANWGLLESDGKRQKTESFTEKSVTFAPRRPFSNKRRKERGRHGGRQEGGKEQSIGRDNLFRSPDFYPLRASASVAACAGRKKGGGGGGRKERAVQLSAARTQPAGQGERARSARCSFSLSHFSRLPYWFRHIILPSPSSRKIGGRNERLVGRICADMLPPRACARNSALCQRAQCVQTRQAAEIRGGSLFSNYNNICHHLIVLLSFGILVAPCWRGREMEQ